MHDASGSAGTVRTNGIAVGVGLLVLAVGATIARDRTVPDAEASVFRAVNDLPGALYPVAWPFQAIGTLVVGPVVALVALAIRHYRLAIAALAVTALKLVTERLVKVMVSRERPATSIGSDVELRGDVPVSGESFVSGHAVLVAGLATVITPYLPGRWRVLPWLLVGGVVVGRVYVGAHNPLDVICGAALGVAIGASVNIVDGVWRRRRVRHHGASSDPERGHRDRPRRTTQSARSRRRRAMAMGAVILAIPTACGGRRSHDAAPSPGADEAITIGSFDFTESRVVAEVYSQGLEAAGYDVDRVFGLGPREFVGPALVAGLVDLVPEYAGTAAEFHSLGAAEPTSDVTVTHDELVGAVADQPLIVLAPAPAQDANTFVVTRETADRLELTALSDLAAVGESLTLGGPAECPTRQLCLVGLTDVYGLSFGEFLPLDPGGALTVQALNEGHVDVALMFTTDPTITEQGFVELADDRGLQPAENITPLIRTEVVDRWGADVVNVIDDVSSQLTTRVLRDLNAAARRDGAEIVAVATAWWAEVTAS